LNTFKLEQPTSAVVMPAQNRILIVVFISFPHLGLPTKPKAVALLW
jgi:hypothetical protein